MKHLESLDLFAHATTLCSRVIRLRCTPAMYVIRRRIGNTVSPSTPSCRMAISGMKIPEIPDMNVVSCSGGRP